MLKLVFDTQKMELENLHAKSPEERKGIAWAFRLNRQALEFATEGRNIEAHIQFMFVEAIMTAIRNGRYDADFGAFWRTCVRPTPHRYPALRSQVVRPTSAKP